MLVPQDWIEKEMKTPETCPNLDCKQENRNTCFKCGQYEGKLIAGEVLATLWHNTPTIRRAEEILKLIKVLRGEHK